MRSVHDTLDWNLLRTFVSIVQEKSISRAARRLNLSQPAVSAEAAGDALGPESD